MKKILPTVLMLAIMFAGYKMMTAGVISPIVLIGMTMAMMLCFLFIRPSAKNAASPEAILEALGEFGKDAFSDDSQLSKDFQTAVANFLGNMPKAALAKLEKIKPQCRTDAEKYAVAMLCATIQCKLNEFSRAIPEYNQAVVLHPTSEVALSIGSCQQRIGELRKARGSYEFALELDPNNVQAMSALATAWVADRKYENALDYAEMALEHAPDNASALATCAICHGLLGNQEESAEFTEKAVREGYNRQKITDTIKALKK